jgi:hypothetical protein
MISSIKYAMQVISLLLTTVASAIGAWYILAKILQYACRH